MSLGPTPALRITYIRNWLLRANETNDWNELNWLGRLVGYVQAQPRSSTRDYLEQIQLVVRAGLEVGSSRFQVLRSNLTTRPRYLL